MTSESIIAHTETINGCNQRGGRMLTLVDLLDAESVDRPLAAYLAAMMRHGSSVLVGAQPGGAGKTTVMCALLNFVPNETTLLDADSLSTLEQAERTPAQGKRCYIAHEISPATYYYAYLWGQKARLFFRLRSQGHIIAANLHADTLEQTREQLLKENGVQPAHLNAVTLKVYLGTQRQSAWSMRRWIRQVYESHGNADHLLWTAEAPGQFTRHARSQVVSESSEQHYAHLLTQMQEEKTHTISDVRRVLLKDTGPKQDFTPAHPQ